MRDNDRKKFVNLANKRVNNVLRTIRLIGNLSNKSNYDYTDDDIKNIFKALDAELKICRQRFESVGASGGEEFRLD